MDIIKEIKELLKEAELYHTQGLIKEAREQYVRAGQMVKKNEKVIKNKSLLSAISKKVRLLNEEIKKFENAPTMIEMPENVQNIIKEKFAFAKDENEASLEGAIALAKFGQYERALKEFHELIKIDSIRVDAAKNIIRCHVALDSISDAVNYYKDWFSGGHFKPAELNKLCIFLQDILDRKKVDIVLPQVEEPKEGEMANEAVYESTEATIADTAAKISATEIPSGEDEIEEEILDISSVGITLDKGPNKGQTVEYDVSFQSGKVINLLISSSDRELLEWLSDGLTLNQLVFYSPIALFKGSGYVVSKSKIESGPKEGDYSLDIKIKKIE